MRGCEAKHIRSRMVGLDLVVSWLLLKSIKDKDRVPSPTCFANLGFLVMISNVVKLVRRKA